MIEGEECYIEFILDFFKIKNFIRDILMIRDLLKLLKLLKCIVNNNYFVFINEVKFIELCIYRNYYK